MKTKLASANINRISNTKYMQLHCT